MHAIASLWACVNQTACRSAGVHGGRHSLPPSAPTQNGSRISHEVHPAPMGGTRPNDDAGMLYIRTQHLPGPLEREVVAFDDNCL